MAWEIIKAAFAIYVVGPLILLAIYFVCEGIRKLRGFWR
jgi:hypothetical protein